MVEAESKTKAAALPPEEGFQVLFKRLKSNNLGFDIFLFLKTKEALLILRALSRKGFEFSLNFYKSAKILRGEFLWQSQRAYPGVNTFNLPVEVNIGCAMDLE